MLKPFGQTNFHVFAFAPGHTETFKCKVPNISHTLPDLNFPNWQTIPKIRPTRPSKTFLDNKFTVFQRPITHINGPLMISLLIADICKISAPIRCLIHFDTALWHNKQRHLPDGPLRLYQSPFKEAAINRICIASVLPGNIDCVNS